MAERDQTVVSIRVVHAAFVMTIFLFVFALHTARLAERPVEPVIVIGISGVAVTDIGMGFYIRRRFMSAALRKLHTEGNEAQALNRWRMANIVSFCHAETVVLFGVVLKALGAGWKMGRPFFVVGFLLLLYWPPKLELPPEASLDLPTPVR